jgi:hypothetical protein
MPSESDDASPPEASADAAGHEGEWSSELAALVDLGHHFSLAPPQDLPADLRPNTPAAAYNPTGMEAAAGTGGGLVAAVASLCLPWLREEGLAPAPLGPAGPARGGYGLGLSEV